MGKGKKPSSLSRTARESFMAGPSKTSRNTTTTTTTSTSRGSEIEVRRPTRPPPPTEVTVDVVYFPLTKEYEDDPDIQDERGPSMNGRWQQLVLKLKPNFVAADIRTGLLNNGFMAPTGAPLFAHNVKIWKPVAPCRDSETRHLSMEDLNRFSMFPMEYITVAHNVEDLVYDINNRNTVFVTYCNDISSPANIEKTEKPPNSKFYSKTFGLYMDYYKLPGNTPSSTSQLANFCTAQSSRFAIYDGRQAPGCPAPLSMRACFYHPVFAKFLVNNTNLELEIPRNTLDATDKLMATVAAVYTKEADFLKVFERIFSELLGCDVKGRVNTNQTRPDGVYMFTGERHGKVFLFPLLIREDKLQAGYSDATTQAELSYIHTACDVECNLLRNYTCCPAFIVGISGNRIEISAAVLTNVCIVERLFTQHIGRSHVQHQHHDKQVARAFYSLALALTELEDWYHGQLSDMDFAIDDEGENIRRPRQRYFPYPHEYTQESSTDPHEKHTVRFIYIRPFQKSAQCVTFLAETVGDPQKKIVVKFVETYCKDLHIFLAEKNLAPRLLYYGPIYPDIPFNKYAGALDMVVMDYFEGQPMHLVNDLTNEERRVVADKVKKAIDLGHERGYVFGDIRRPNVLRSQDGEVRLIDFDWSGEIDKVTYPADLTPGIWVDGVKSHDPITKDHDMAMWAKNFKVTGA